MKKYTIEQYEFYNRLQRKTIVSYRLKGHSKRSGSMIFSCVHCHKRFLQEGYVGVPQKEWPCGYCGKTGLRKSSIRELNHDPRSERVGLRQ